MDSPWLHRNLPLFIAATVVVIPALLFFGTLPGSASGGGMHVSGGLRASLLIPAAALGLAGLVVVFWRLLTDHELLFGSATAFTVLTTVAVLASVLVRRHLENDAAKTFLLVAALSISSLILIAHDWARRQLVIAAAVIAAVISLLIVRIGYESLSVPPLWDRTQIATQAQEDEITLIAQRMHDLKGLRSAAATAQAALHGIISGSPGLNVEHNLIDQAKIILAASTPLESVNQADFTKFDKLVNNEPTTFPTAATAQLSGAVHALLVADEAATAHIGHLALDEARCTVLGHRFIVKTKTCSTGGPDAITSNYLWVNAKHHLEVELATYRAAVTGTDADNAALSKVLAQQPAIDTSISLLAAIENGPETLWGSAFGSAGPPVVPGPLGWVILGAVMLGLLGWLLKVNASQLAGPVEVVKGDNKQDLVTVLRVAVLQNVAEPGAAPGAPSANPVTTLLDIAGGPLGPVSKIVQAVLTVAGRRYGYQVSMDVTTNAPSTASTSSAGAAAPGTQSTAAAAKSTNEITTVLVRIMSVSGGTTLASHMFAEPVSEEAVKAAGLWSAGWILNKSSRIPSWAAWNAETAHALVMADNRRDSAVSLAVLEAALPEAPDSGILLTRLGHRYELDGRRLDAIRCYARAVTAHPHYWVARYRMAAALGAMRHDKTWSKRPAAQRTDDLRTVGPAISALHLKKEVGPRLHQLQSGKPPIDGPGDFKWLATKLFSALAVDTRYLHRLVSTLRRSERDSTWPSLAPMSPHIARRFHGLVISAHMSLGDDDQLNKLLERAQKPQSWWQVSYNAACGYASSIDPKDHSKACYPQRSLSLLEQTLVRTGIHQLSAEWVKKDPALTNIASSPRFLSFVAQLRSGD